MPRALAWMAPQGARRRAGAGLAEAEHPQTGRCRDRGLRLRPAAAFVAGDGRARPAPVWINLEYLSAEAYVERSHGLPSPQRLAA
jgi:hypothetical protein